VGVGVGSGPRTASTMAVCREYRNQAKAKETRIQPTHGQTGGRLGLRIVSRYIRFEGLSDVGCA